MAANDLDGIIALTNGPAWPTNDDPNEGDLDGHFEYFVGSSGAAAVLGLRRHHTVPAGYIEGPPVGITSVVAGPSRSCSASPTTRARRTCIGVAAAIHSDDRHDLFPVAPNPPHQMEARRKRRRRDQLHSPVARLPLEARRWSQRACPAARRAASFAAVAGPIRRAAAAETPAGRGISTRAAQRQLDGHRCTCMGIGQFDQAGFGRWNPGDDIAERLRYLEPPTTVPRPHQKRTVGSASASATACSTRASSGRRRA